MNLFKLILLLQLIVKKSISQMEDKYWLNYINSDRLESITPRDKFIEWYLELYL
jgi:hypothetical protein